MNLTFVRDIFKKPGLSRRFSIIIVMFISVLLGLLTYTLATVQNNRSNAILIDMAGRQRMLLQKHTSEVFLTSQGIPAQYESTRQLLQSTLLALQDGGLVVLNPETDQRQVIPAAPTQEILKKLKEQKKQIDHLQQISNHFLSFTPGHPEYRPQLQTLRTELSRTIDTADDAVKLFNEYAKSTVATMVGWEILTAIFAGLLGVVVTNQGVRDAKRMESEIEERRRAEAALRDSKLFLNSIVENIPHMIFVKDAQNLQFLRWNKAGEELVGYQNEALIGKTDYDFFPKFEADFYAKKDREVLASKKKQDIPEEILQTKSRGTRYLHTIKIPILDADENPQYLLGISEDITERKEKDVQLKTVSHRLLLATASAKIGIWDWDIPKDVLSWDEQMFKLFGLVKEDRKIGYEMWARTLHPEDRKRAETELQQAIQGIEGFHTEFRIVWPDQSVHTIQAHAVVQQDDAGTAIRIIGVNWDISERKKTEEALRESEGNRIEALRQSDDLKSALLSSVSHELRTPLTTMKSSISSIIGNGPIGMNEIQIEFLKGIDQEINYLSHLVDNLLDMSQIEAKTLVPHREWHPLEDLIEGALRRTEQAIKPRNIEVHIPDIVPPVNVDAVKMQQVLINLLDNAVKYSLPDSTIQIQVGIESHQVTVKIANEGEPLEATDLERIFERFYRRHVARDKPIHGTGLGLAICKGIIEAHNGRIWAESVGSKVAINFILPATEPMRIFSLEGLHKG